MIPRPAHRRVMGTILLPWVAWSQAQAQEQIYSVVGSCSAGGAGVVAPFSDVDVDGVRDFLIGAPFDSTGALYGGRVQLCSGVDGSVLREWFGADLEFLGGALARADDADGDGLDDVLVSSNSGGTFGPQVRLYSSGSGALLRSHERSSGGGRFGDQVIDLGDVDGDSVADFAVLGSFEFVSLPVVDLFSGASGALIRSLPPPQAFSYTSIDRVGDLDADGRSEIAVGDVGERNAQGELVGAVRIYSGASGALLQTLVGDHSEDFIGMTVAGLSDVDGDGVPDLAVTHSSPTVDDDTAVVIYSLKSGIKLREWESPIPGSHFGSALAEVGDVDDDGVADIAVGARSCAVAGEDGAGAVFLYSGRTLDRLYSFWGDLENLNLGTAAAIGDIDGDGRADLLLGATGKGADGSYPGRVEARSGNDLFLSASSPGPLPGESITFATAVGVPGNLVGLFVVAVNGAPFFLLLNIGNFDAQGRRDLTFTVPPGLIGISISHKTFALDHANRVIDTGTEIVTYR